MRLRTDAVDLGQLAHTDDLTGLRNARALWRDLDDLSRRGPLALIILDLDRFKAVNDAHGHAVGDSVLRRAGSAIRAVVGDPGSCYRYGGEELVVLLPGTDEADAAALAGRLRTRIGEAHAELPRVTVSAGVAVATPGVPGDHLLDRADRALRRAKAEGRDRVVRETDLIGLGALEDEATMAARRAALAIATAALEARDPDTADHSQDVVLLCAAVADRLGIEGFEREHLLSAARLHDVGKVAVPHEILGKPDALDEAEWTVIRRHTITGERILQAVPELAPVAPIVRSAHERYDGNGYPDGLAGEDIPLASRVILCADAFHAIRSDRPYRAGRPVKEAVRELEAHAGTQFDPDVAAALVAVVRDAGAPEHGLGRALRTSPRLMALLVTLTVGGTAFAAEAPLRHAVARVTGHHRSTAHRPAAAPHAPGAPASCAPLALESSSCASVPLGALLVPSPIRARHSVGAMAAAPHAKRASDASAPTPAPTPAAVALGPPSAPAAAPANPDTAPAAPSSPAAAVPEVAPTVAPAAQLPAAPAVPAVPTVPVPVPLPDAGKVIDGGPQTSHGLPKVPGPPPVKGAALPAPALPIKVPLPTAEALAPVHVDEGHGDRSSPPSEPGPAGGDSNGNGHGNGNGNGRNNGNGRSGH